MALSLVHIVADSAQRLRSLDRYGLDLKPRAARRLDASRFAVPGILSDDQIAVVTGAGFAVEIVADLSRVAEQRSEDVSRVNRFAGARGLETFRDRAVLGYMTVDEIESALINLQALHPSLVSLIQLPNPSWEGRISRAVRVRAGTSTSRIGVLLTGGMHAREWGGSDICVTFIVNLINAYQANSGLTYGGKTFGATEVRTILEHLDLFVFPDVNPDGKHYSQTYNPSSGQAQQFWWRKNRNPNSAVGAGARGVDLNRNFDFLWNSGIGTSTSPSSNTYKGTAAFSEPETRNVRHLLETYPSIGYFVDIHSYGGLILYSWGDDDNQSTEPSRNFLNPAHDGTRGVPGDTLYREFLSTLDENTVVGLATRMNAALTAVRGETYTVQQAVGLYPTSATSDDYAFGRHVVNGLNRKVYAFTVEFGQEFVPPIAEMNNVIADVCAALTELCWAANSDVYVRDNPADTTGSPSTGPFWDSPDIWVRNADDGGTTHQDTIRGQDNFVRVRVHNRGKADARDLKVRVCLANFAGTQFTYPDDWIAKNPAGGGSLAGVGTYLIGEADIAKLDPTASHIVTVRWPAALIPQELNWHPCLLVEVSPNDGALLPGDNVWESNNLGQKNISVIDAGRGELVTFPFWIGSASSRLTAEDLVLKRVRVPPGVAVFVDVEDPRLAEWLRPALSPRPPLRPGPPAEPVHEAASLATLLQATTVAVSLADSTIHEEGDVLVLRLPASTRIEVEQAPQEASPAVARESLVSGFELAAIGDTMLLKLVAAKQGRIRLPLDVGQMKRLALKVAVPDTAVVGERYELQAVQYDAAGRAVGGVVLSINVVR